MLVEKYKIGNTMIEIYDDAYKDKTQKDIDEIIKRLERIASNAFSKKQTDTKEVME